jgi:hypothetical protein
MTCLLDCRLEAANSGQVDRSICRKEAMSTTVPAVTPRCHSSKASGTYKHTLLALIAAYDQIPVSAHVKHYILSYRISFHVDHDY